MKVHLLWVLWRLQRTLCLQRHTSSEPLSPFWSLLRVWLFGWQPPRLKCCSVRLKPKHHHDQEGTNATSVSYKRFFFTHIGVPQGRVLGPKALLYLKYLSYLCSCVGFQPCYFLLLLSTLHYLLLFRRLALFSAVAL